MLPFCLAYGIITILKEQIKEIVMFSFEVGGIEDLGGYEEAVERHSLAKLVSGRLQVLSDAKHRGSSLLVRQLHCSCLFVVFMVLYQC